MSYNFQTPRSGYSPKAAYFVSRDAVIPFPTYREIHPRTYDMIRELRFVSPAVGIGSDGFNCDNGIPAEMHLKICDYVSVVFEEWNGQLKVERLGMGFANARKVLERFQELLPTADKASGLFEAAVQARIASRQK